MRHALANLLWVFLVGACVAPQRSSDTPLTGAARAGDAAEVRRLIANGADPNERDSYAGWPPIVHAVHKHQLASIEALLAGGADINATTPGGTTALMMAASYGQNDSVRLLLARGANTSLRDHNGETALDLAYSGTSDIDRFTFFDCLPDTVRLLRAAHAPGAPSRWAKFKGCDA
jgi:hypothetical protein